MLAAADPKSGWTWYQEDCSCRSDACDEGAAAECEIVKGEWSGPPDCLCNTDCADKDCGDCGGCVNGACVCEGQSGIWKCAGDSSGCYWTLGGTAPTVTYYSDNWQTDDPYTGPDDKPIPV